MRLIVCENFNLYGKTVYEPLRFLPDISFELLGTSACIAYTTVRTMTLYLYRQSINLRWYITNLPLKKTLTSNIQIISYDIQIFNIVSSSENNVQKVHRYAGYMFFIFFVDSVTQNEQASFTRVAVSSISCLIQTTCYKPEIDRGYLVRLDQTTK